MQEIYASAAVGAAINDTSHRRLTDAAAYFSGPGGVTPPGGNQGAPGSLVTGFTPDLRKNENRLNMAILVKF